LITNLQRTDFAERRLHELLKLNNGNLLGANELDRQQLIQEFFFHLVGTIEELAQLVNDKRGLNLPSESVSIRSVAEHLPPNDQLVPKLQALYSNTRGQPLPPDPYSDDGYMFRTYNYRNQVAHRGRNPWNFNIGKGAVEPTSITLQLDPRGTNRVGSIKSVQDDLEYMFRLVKKRCSDALSVL